jgi:hypothetical protein
MATLPEAVYATPSRTAENRCFGNIVRVEPNTVAKTYDFPITPGPGWRLVFTEDLKEGEIQWGVPPGERRPHILQVFPTLEAVMLYLETAPNPMIADAGAWESAAAAPLPGLH